jgi:hypothetical protein
MHLSIGSVETLLVFSDSSKCAQSCRVGIPVSPLLDPHIQGFRQNKRRRAKSQGWLALESEFEIATAVRNGSQPRCSASEKMTDFVGRFSL